MCFCSFVPRRKRINLLRGTVLELYKYNRRSFSFCSDKYTGFRKQVLHAFDLSMRDFEQYSVFIICNST